MKIVYRIVAALLAAAVFPAAYFLALIRIRVGVSLLPSDVMEELSIQRLVELFGQDGYLSGLFDGRDGSEFFALPAVKSLMPAAVSFGVFFVLALLLALVIVFFAALSNKRTVITCLGGGGLLSMIAAMISFGQLASPIIKGTISVGDFLNMGFIGALVGSAVQVKILQLTSAAIMMTVLFAAIVLWGLAFIVTDEDRQPKPIKPTKNKKRAKR